MTVALEEVAGLLGINPRTDRLTSPFEIILRVEEGLPIATLDRISRTVAPDNANFKYQIVSRATFARRRQRQEKLSVNEGDRVVRLAKIWAFAREVWGGDEAARAFFFRPHMLLEGRRPIDVVLATDLGARMVEDILGRLKYGSAA